MTTLCSLEIQGIRCFAPGNPQAIHFEKPLTLIVGQNGAGKTTIVECLKMAASGILPPNADRGKSFVHDSKLAEAGEVRAQITLKVETYTRDVVSATRKYTITRDKNIPNKSTFKAGETVLHVKPFVGEESTVSMKCTDMDNSMPALMGLSKALIDSVIFCHQDENNWALDDLAKVKARFDDLLETSRYTKALAALNKSKRDQDDAIKVKTSQLEYAKCQIVQMADLRNQVKTNMEDNAKTNSDIVHLENEMVKLNNAAKTLRTEFEAVSTLINAVKVTTGLADRLSGEIKDMQQNMDDIYEEGLDDIRIFHRTLTNEVETAEAMHNNVSLKIDQLMDTLNGLHHKIDSVKTKMTSRVLLKEAAKAMSENVASLKAEIIKELDASDEAEFDEMNVAAFIEQASHFSQDDIANSTAFNECKGTIKILEEKMFQLTTQESAKDAVMTTLAREMLDTQTQIDAMGDTRSTLEQLECRRQQLRQHLEEKECRLRTLLKQKEQLSVSASRLRNSINALQLGHRDELATAIKFLESIVNNDRQCILTYVKQVVSADIDEMDYQEDLRKFFGKLIAPNGQMDGLINPEQFKQDCVTAVIQMVQHHNGGEECCLNGIITEGSGTQPYNVLLKLATNTRIAEYITYYKTMLQQNGKDAANVAVDGSYADVMLKLESAAAEIQGLEADIVSANNCVTDLNAQTTHLASKVELGNILSSKMAEMQARQQQYSTEIKEIRESTESVKTQLRDKRVELDEINEKLTSANTSNAVKVARLTTLMDRYLEKREELLKAELELEDTRDDACDGDNNGNLQNEINTITECIQHNRSEQRELMQSVNKHRQLLQNLQQNITLKLKQQQLSETRKQLDTLRQQMGPSNEAELASLIRDNTEKCTRTGLEIAKLRGTLMTREENIAKLQQMLQSDNYRHAQKKYTDTLVELKSHTMAKEDLDLYSRTLELGLHKFHSEKIAQINTVLKRVWREVYTGGQIDYIEIQSNVDTTVPSTGLMPKSYNYRLVMVTHAGVEMDMRGHCSAGERVLASLIVRITLTEAFCTNCNILTLDEPTTNLDRENIVSLEASLAKLVNECSIDFQLVLITHDEPFARKMALKCNCDKYYKITKNERNESIINAVPFGSFFMT